MGHSIKSSIDSGSSKMGLFSVSSRKRAGALAPWSFTESIESKLDILVSLEDGTDAVVIAETPVFERLLELDIEM